MIDTLSQQELLSVISRLPADKKDAVKEILSELNKRKTKEEAQTKFLKYVKYVWTDFINGRHHRIMADAFERVAQGDLNASL